MKIMVTGGSGFIGSAFVRLALGTGAASAVLNLDRLSYASSPEALEEVASHPGYSFAHVDIRRGGEVASLLAAFQPDAVVHLAAETHVDRSIDDPSPFLAHNVDGTFQLLEAVRAHWRALPAPARDLFRFVHVSTDEVFGSLDFDSPPFTPATPYAPRSPYAASKAASDHLVRAWHATYGLPAMVTNCGNNYGPFQFPEKLIPLATIKALTGQPIPVYGQGLNRRDWIHVDDHAAALLAAARAGRPGATYLVGGDGEHSNIDVVEAICDILDRLEPGPEGGRRRLIGFVADRPGHDLRYAIDSAATRRELGWRPRKDFASGLAETVEWYRNQRNWWGRILSERYDGSRLGGNA